jgi:hypothetical protein
MPTMTHAQRQVHFEELHRRIEHAIADYEGATGEEVTEVAVLRGGREVKVMIRPAPN